MIEIANHELLGSELAMRGGTCLQKLYLRRPLRYSEDLDYVRRTRSGIAPYMDGLRQVATGVGLEEHRYEQAGQMVHMVFDAEPTSGIGRIRVKIEINIREVEGLREPVSRELAIDSPWWMGKANIPTFLIEELMGTKLRALYQRRKGRDLFDLWVVLTTLAPDDALIVEAFRHYIGEEIFGFADLAANLTDKLENREFRDDLSQLLLDPPSGYELDAAANLVMERLGSRLDGAPKMAKIRDGSWRA